MTRRILIEGKAYDREHETLLRRLANVHMDVLLESMELNDLGALRKRVELSDGSTMVLRVAGGQEIVTIYTPKVEPPEVEEYEEEKQPEEYLNFVCVLAVRYVKKRITHSDRETADRRTVDDYTVPPRIVYYGVYREKQKDGTIVYLKTMLSESIVQQYFQTTTIWDTYLVRSWGIKNGATADDIPNPVGGETKESTHIGKDGDGACGGQGFYAKRNIGKSIRPNRDGNKIIRLPNGKYISFFYGDMGFSAIASGGGHDEYYSNLSFFKLEDLGIENVVPGYYTGRTYSIDWEGEAVLTRVTIEGVVYSGFMRHLTVL
jgi:hypothetical protein